MKEKRKEERGEKREEQKSNTEHNAKNFPGLIKSMNHHRESLTNPTRKGRNKYRDPTMKSHKIRAKGTTVKTSLSPKRK